MEVKRNGVFVVDFAHELGHAIVGRAGGLRIDRIMIQDIVRSDGSVRVRGGGRTEWISTVNHPKWNCAVTAAAGAVAEAILAHERDLIIGYIRRLLQDPDFATDLNDIRDAGRLHFGRDIQEPSDIEAAIAEARAILIPRTEAIIQLVARCEEKAVASKSPSFVLNWGTRHDALFGLEVEDRPFTLPKA